MQRARVHIHSTSPQLPQYQPSKPPLLLPPEMRRSDEAQAFIWGVYMAVQEIPHGRVTTYGHIAKLIGKPQCPRQVGQALKHLPPASTAADNTYHTGNVPWQRVIASDGTVPRRDDPGGAARHAQVLRDEGIEVGTKADGRFMVDLEVVGWFPEVLPSEEDEEEEGETA
ncbi:6-O-methylguanine DNA methyltransferase [Tricharina praecox]|uniref:6-O-methylguanine DNA methyltransferase n=1 Tax=Tricharina praecox TaxID=43433 RepID=UPI00222046C0|nr:6-O-methylguanine DNA methyltransferase [Tricharina praecox]KAI5848298.1 6-O-methylguanine DNA methyltransferase [Tricharina praecox]